MKTRVEKVPVFEKVEIGTADKTIFIADDGTEFGTEARANIHNEQISKNLRYKEAEERMKLKNVSILGEDYFLIKTTTLEDLYILENYKSHYCCNTEKRYFTSGEWVFGRRVDGGDYKDYFYYEKLEELKSEFNFICEYVEMK